MGLSLGLASLCPCECDRIAGLGFGVLRLDQGRQELAWLANILGGYLFGIGMVLAGGCASGTWYRVGEGLVGSWMAALGFMLGAAAVGNGAFSGLYAYLRGFVLSPGSSMTIDGLLGVNRWVVILPASALALLLAYAIANALRPLKRALKADGTWPMLRWILLGSLFLDVAGIWWGLPGSWPPGELSPKAVLEGMSQRFSHGWYDTYPPVHFYLLSIVVSPVLWLGRLGLLDLS